MNECTGGCGRLTGTDDPSGMCRECADAVEALDDTDDSTPGCGLCGGSGGFGTDGKLPCPECQGTGVAQ